MKTDDKGASLFRGQARLRLAFVNGVEVSDGRGAVPLRYAQSASGQSVSHRTRPPDSRSMAIASASEHDRVPYATFRRCPWEVPQRSAKAERSSTLMLFQNSRSSMAQYYHHAVIGNATPFGEFTKWCAAPDNAGMQDEIVKVRRQNLRNLIARDFGGNKSAIAREYDRENPKPSYFSDLVRDTSGKSFGEKAARKIEQRIGLLPGQLDIPNSPLIYEKSRRSRIKEQIFLEVETMNADEERETLAFIRRLRTRRKSA